MIHLETNHYYYYLFHVNTSKQNIQTNDNNEIIKKLVLT